MRIDLDAPTPLFYAIRSHQRIAGCVADAADNGGILARRQRNEDRRFEIVGGSEATCFKVGLLSVFPIVVRHDPDAIGIAHVQSWICQDIGYAELSEGGPKAADDHRFAASASDN